MIMEHFEVHKEQLEDMLVELDRYGPKVITDLPAEKAPDTKITMQDFALIDELSGLNLFMDNFMKSHNLSQMQRDRIEARMVRYSGDKPKDIALNEMRMFLYGDSR